MKDIPLGQATAYIDTYAPELLAPVSRQPIRESLGIQTLDMQGVDIWNIYEASWLDGNGKPNIACLELSYPADSPAIVESKSLKLYFNSMNQTKFETRTTYLNTIVKDVSEIVAAPVTLTEVQTLETAEQWLKEYSCIDNQDVKISDYQPNPELLSGAFDANNIVKEKLVSHLFKTNCMVTGQPDWGSVFIDYEGPQLERQRLLAYLISFRDHQAFHEPSCEMIFDHLIRYCQPLALSVYCRYTRRGGIDINPYRSTTAATTPPNLRMLRQ